MRFFRLPLRLSLPVILAVSIAGGICHAQTPAPGSIPVKSKKSDQPQIPQRPPQPKPPALMDPAGPTISLQTSEAVFDIAVALNACGYDNGLDTSDPVRKHIRDQVNQATAQSAEARDARDKLCFFIDQHRLSEAAPDLAQYISLALYVTAPPELEPSVQESEMPPDSTQVLDVLPLLRTFADKIQLHAIFIANHAAYEEVIQRLHDPLTKMIVDTNLYLKMPASTYDGRRFLVVLEPLLSPAETNARVYGSDYVIVTSPNDGTINMDAVRHTYLHYEIEPLLYARAGAIDRFLPFLKIVREAPLDFEYRSDIVSLVIESMIHSIEARTMQTGVVIPPLPADTLRPDLEPQFRAHNVAIQKDAAVRQQAVSKSMSQGYVLTQYFYNQLIAFERNPASLEASIGEMVYGMDVDAEIHRARDVKFVEEGSSDVIRRPTLHPRGLDLAELDLQKGDVKTATDLSQTALNQHTSDAARANFILARASLLSGEIDDAEGAFRETVRLSSDPRILAWSHIYLGRILDVEDKRDDALNEYKAALTVRDGQPDTRRAAEKGIAAPFALPKHETSDGDDDEKTADPKNTDTKAAAPTASNQHPQ
jgi:hypothetical protein